MSNQESSPPLQCFLSADASTDVAAVRDVLLSMGVHVFDLSNLELGQSFIKAIDEAVLSSDFVCIVLGTSRPGSAVMFEAGMAAGSRRPIVVIADSLQTDPALLQLFASPVIRYTAGRETALREGLRAYVDGVQPIAAQLKVDWDPLMRSAANSEALSAYSASGTAFERHVVSQLASLGALVVSRVVLDPRNEADALATFPSLGSAFNPVLIEIRVAAPRKRPGVDFQRLLQQRMALAGSRIALVFYRDDEPFKVTNLGGVCIIEANAKRLEAWTAQALLRQLTDVRNQLVHSI